MPTPGISAGILISSEEMRQLPIAGQAGCASGTLCYDAWNHIITVANYTPDPPNIDVYNNNGNSHHAVTLAAAIAAKRLSFEQGKEALAQSYYNKAVAGFMAVIGTEQSSVPNADGSGGLDDGSLAIARNFSWYVIGSDVIGLYPDGNATSVGTKWGNYVDYMLHQKFTFRTGDGGGDMALCSSNGGCVLTGCASNGCAVGLATGTAAAAYLKDNQELNARWLVFRRYTGDSGSSATINFSSSGDAWYHNATQKLAINPKGATCYGTGYPADGVLPNDQGRGGSCPTGLNTQPAYTQYPWEGIGGAYLSAILFQRLGYTDSLGKDAFHLSDNALLRAVNYQWCLQNKFGGSWYDSSRAGWVKHLAYRVYGFKPINYSFIAGTKNMGFIQWTQQNFSDGPNVSPLPCPF